MARLRCLLLLTALACIKGQRFVPPHHAVLRLDDEESRLHPGLRSRALDNPSLVDAMRKSSWFHHGENPVFDRETEKIPRENIVAVLTHAGFVPRRAQFNHVDNFGDGGSLSFPLPDFPLPDLDLQFI